MVSTWMFFQRSIPAALWVMSQYPLVIKHGNGKSTKINMEFVGKTISKHAPLVSRTCFFFSQIIFLQMYPCGIYQQHWERFFAISPSLHRHLREIMSQAKGELVMFFFFPHFILTCPYRKKRHVQYPSPPVVKVPAPKTGWWCSSYLYIYISLSLPLHICIYYIYIDIANICNPEAVPEDLCCAPSLAGEHGKLQHIPTYYSFLHRLLVKTCHLCNFNARILVVFSSGYTCACYFSTTLQWPNFMAPKWCFHVP